MGYIYRLKSNVTGKAYIGQTSNSLEERFGTSGINYIYIDPVTGKAKQTELLMHILQDGWKSFSKEIVAIVPNELLGFAETYFILKENTYMNGYNMTIGLFYKEIRPEPSELEHYKSEVFKLYPNYKDQIQVINTPVMQTKAERKANAKSQPQPKPVSNNQPKVDLKREFHNLPHISKNDKYFPSQADPEKRYKNYRAWVDNGMKIVVYSENRLVDTFIGRCKFLHTFPQYKSALDSNISHLESKLTTFQLSKNLSAAVYI